MDSDRVLLYDELSSRVRDADYAVRGRLVEKALSIAGEVKSGTIEDTSEMIFCNIGNPQSLGQLPITFFRSVMSMCMLPTHLRDGLKALGEEMSGLPIDVFERAEKYQEIMVNGFGAYSDSRGFSGVRKEVDDSDWRRKGKESDNRFRTFQTHQYVFVFV
jgi:alanine transaminase